jgi:hypothetical protein
MENQREEFIFKFRKENENNFTLCELNFILKKIEKALNAYYRECGYTKKADLDELSPEITNLDNGCIEITAIVTGVIASILADLIIKVFEKIRKRIYVSHEQNRIIADFATVKKRKKWKYSDDYEVVEKIFKEYVNKNSNLSILGFVNTLKLSKLFSTISIKDKIYNIKFLLEKNKIKNSLKCPQMSHCSKQSINIFEKVCIALGIKLK